MLIVRLQVLIYIDILARQHLQLLTLNLSCLSQHDQDITGCNNQPLEVAVCISGLHGLFLDVDTRSLSNSMGIAPSLWLLRLEMPELCAKAEVTLKQSSIKSLLPSTECSIASHCARIRLICLAQFARRTGFFRNLKKLIKLVGVLEQQHNGESSTIEK